VARLFIDGFEAGDYNLWNTVNVPAAISVTTSGSPASGSYHVSITSSSNYPYLEKNLGSTKTELYVKFRYKPYSQHSYNKHLLTFRDGAGTVIASLARNTTSYKLEARRGGNAGTLLATGTAALQLDTYYLIEVRYKPLDSGGVFQVKVDGILDIDYSGDTTNGNQNVQYVRIGSSAETGVYCYAYFDDVVIDDANWIGNSRIQGIRPNGAGNSTQWDPSAGNNWDCVDEVPLSDTDYVSTNVTDEIDLYALGNLAGSVGSVKCIQVQARAAYEGTPIPTKQQLAVRTNSNNYFSSSQSPPSAFGMPIRNIWETNPNTSAAWTESEINALEAGIKAVA